LTNDGFNCFAIDYDLPSFSILLGGHFAWLDPGLAFGDLFLFWFVLGFAYDMMRK